MNSFNLEIEWYIFVFQIFDKITIYYQVQYVGIYINIYINSNY